MSSGVSGLRVGVIATPTVAMGFRLSGLHVVAADSVAEAEERLDAMAGGGGWGVVLVQEELLPESASTARSAMAGGLPIVVSLPGPAPEQPIDEATAYVTELLRRAVGYRVRLR